MPKYNIKNDDLPDFFFSDISAKIEASKRIDFIPLHQGKTWFNPCAENRNWKESEFSYKYFEHAPPSGISELKEYISKKLENQMAKVINPNEIVITNGATNAIYIVLRVILNPGDEVILLSPQWLFASGIVKAAGGTPIEVPIFTEMNKDNNFDILATIENSINGKTKAIYFNTPNNPTGISLNNINLEKILHLAEKYDLWIISDNAYENYDFSKEGFIDILKLVTKNVRIISIYTFSKTYAMPGFRIGYLICPEEIAPSVKKILLYNNYSISTISQFGGFQAIMTSKNVLESYKQLAKEALDFVKVHIKIPHIEPESGIYMFLDLSNFDERKFNIFYNGCFDEGVSLVTGSAFGNCFSKYARICYTSVNLEKLSMGINRLNNAYYKILK